MRDGKLEPFNSKIGPKLSNPLDSIQFLKLLKNHLREAERKCTQRIHLLEDSAEQIRMVFRNVHRIKPIRLCGTRTENGKKRRKPL